MVSLVATYFFLYPAGHFGATAVTFFVTLPLMHVIVVFFAAGFEVGEGVGVALGDAASFS